MDRSDRPEAAGHKLSNLTALSFRACGSYGRADAARDTCERFTRAAGLLPAGGLLGWRLCPGGEGATRTFTFSSPGAEVTREDLGWIFEPCADALEAPQNAAEALGPAVYALRHAPREPGAEAGAGRRQRRDFPARGGELLDALGALGGSIEITTGVDLGGQGMVFVRLPAAITLRLRTMLSQVFPDTVAVEAADPDRLEPLPDTCLTDGMRRLLETLMCEEPSDPLDELPDDGLELLLDDDDDNGPPAPAAVGDPLARLNELIGLDGVKEQFRQIAAFARLKQDLEQRGGAAVPIVLNMAFSGNPGTAKTTVARIAAGMFRSLGLLESDEIVEVGRADLVAKYVGQTAEMVRKVFERARGRLLFIDEAYSLSECAAGDFGDEALTAIVQEMENRRADTIVIFAGYPEKMPAFFARNPGLRSRVPFHIDFPDYSGDELTRIVELEARSRGFALDAEARERVSAICAWAAGRPGAGNGRFCRNLVERAVLGFASRVYGGGGAAPGEFTLTAADFTCPEPPAGPGPARPIGFAA